MLGKKEIQKYIEIVKYLVDKGANLNLQNVVSSFSIVFTYTIALSVSDRVERQR